MNWQRENFVKFTKFNTHKIYVHEFDTLFVHLRMEICQFTHKMFVLNFLCFRFLLSGNNGISSVSS